MRPPLPIDEALPALRAALADRGIAVLQAPPGAGKSTAVPLALLDAPWMAGQKLLLLEPRRLAARAVAERMASTLGERAGETVGYRMRLETKVSRVTRIEVVTEGILTRLIQSDPALEGIAAVIFDEFHERSLNADLGLALCLETRAALRPELRLLVMSATLDGEAVARLLGDAPIVTAEGRSFPVEVEYLGRAMPLLPGGDEPPERAVVLAVRRALRELDGDVLVFLPGAPEIRRVQGMLEGSEWPAGVELRALYGELTGEAQGAALEPARERRRRVVLATNIAETSLTIPGVRVVIDSGLVRRAVFDPARGMSRLETRRLSRASSEQRAGRAGRTAPGVCLRLWGEGAQRSLAPFTPPEIVEADLASLALELAAWGTTDASSLAWLDPPPSAQLASARELLRELGALDETHRITAHGRAMAQIPAHPRLAHLLVRAREEGEGTLAAQIAALLGERDILRGGERAWERDADLRTRLEALRRGGAGVEADRGGVERVRRIARQLGARDDATHDAILDAGEWLALAYPDRVGRRRGGEGELRYALANGRGAAFTSPQSLSRSEFIVVADLDDVAREGRIRLAAPVSLKALERRLGPAILAEDLVEWDPREEALRARRVRRLGALVVEERPLRELPPGRALEAMLEGLSAMGLEVLPWTEEARNWQQRVAFARAVEPDGDWPDFSEGALSASTADWLAPWLDGITRRAHLSRLSMAEILSLRLSHAQREALARLAPTHLTMPTGTRQRVDYSDPSAPAVAVRMQEVFGLPTSPRVGGGRVPVTFSLLSPARRPLQVTRDLDSFWRGAYAEVRKDMRGRYPRHYWPEDPRLAEPTRGIKKRS